jgi:hypothetical protein
MEINLSEDNKTILINTSDNFYTVKGVAFKHFKQLCDYQKELISILIKYAGHIQYTLEDTKAINIIKKINKLMFSEVENLLDELNVNEIFNLYFTSNDVNNLDGFRILTKSEVENQVLDLKPSYISVVNGMDFFSIIHQTLEKRKQEMEKEVSP